MRPCLHAQGGALPVNNSQTKPAHYPYSRKKPKPKATSSPETNRSARPADPRDRPKGHRTILRAYRTQTRQGLSHKLYLASLQCLQDFAGHRIAQLPRTSWEHKLSSHQGTSSLRRRRIFVLWCSLEHKTFRILKMHGQSPPGCKVSSGSVYLCYLFIDTGYAWYGQCHWNFQ